MVSQPEEMYAIVELMGHARIAGRITEQVLAGGTYLRVDVPAVDDRVSFTKLYSPGAVYCITPCDKATAEAAAAAFIVRPISVYDFQHRALAECVSIFTDDEDES